MTNAYYGQGFIHRKTGDKPFCMFLGFATPNEDGGLKPSTEQEFDKLMMGEIKRRRSTIPDDYTIFAVPTGAYRCECCPLGQEICGGGK